jgi:NTE family protein
LTVKKINLALQGGGAHGAFTWGVLDQMLQDPRIEIAALSGTSAGALNAAALKAGMIQGGVEGAREKLEWLWTTIAGSNGDNMEQW